MKKIVVLNIIAAIAVQTVGAHDRQLPQDVENAKKALVAAGVVTSVASATAVVQPMIENAHNRYTKKVDYMHNVLQHKFAGLRYNFLGDKKRLAQNKYDNDNRTADLKRAEADFQKKVGILSQEYAEQKKSIRNTDNRNQGKNEPLKEYTAQYEKKYAFLEREHKLKCSSFKFRLERYERECKELKESYTLEKLNFKKQQFGTFKYKKLRFLQKVTGSMAARMPRIVQGGYMLAAGLGLLGATNLVNHKIESLRTKQ